MWCYPVFYRDFNGLFFFKQKTAYEWRMSDWSSDVCSSDLSPSQSSPSQRIPSRIASIAGWVERARSVSSMRSRNLPPWWRANSQLNSAVRAPPIWRKPVGDGAKRVTTPVSDLALNCACSQAGKKRSEEHTSELQYLMRIT